MSIVAIDMIWCVPLDRNTQTRGKCITSETMSNIQGPDTSLLRAGVTRFRVWIINAMSIICIQMNPILILVMGSHSLTDISYTHISIECSAWISNCSQWDVITHPCLNCNSGLAKTAIKLEHGNDIPYKTVNEITYPYPGLCLYLLLNWIPAIIIMHDMWFAGRLSILYEHIPNAYN